MIDKQLHQIVKLKICSKSGVIINNCHIFGEGFGEGFINVQVPSWT